MMTLDEKIAAARYNTRLYAAAPDLHRLALDLAAVNQETPNAE